MRTSGCGVLVVALGSPAATSACTGGAHLLAVHTPLLQSPLAMQARPMAHGVQPVPQSVSLSLPFFTPSSQRGAWQMLPMHTELAQSEAALQPSPLAQPEQPPPQSTPVSVPF